MPNLRDTVLEHVNNPNYHPVKPAVIAKKLGLANEAAEQLKKTIKRMVKAGELAWGPSHLVYPASKPQRQKSEPGSSGKKRDDGALSPAAAKKTEVAADRAAQRKVDKSRKPPRDSKHF